MWFDDYARGKRFLSIVFQISPERQAEVTKVEGIFRSFDKEGKGAVEVFFKAKYRK